MPGADHSPDWRDLDASVLHALLLDRLWRADEARTSYAHEAAGALRLAARLDGVAVLMRPVTVETVHALAARGERMPRKSTSFGPKPRTGLVLAAPRPLTDPSRGSRRRPSAGRAGASPAPPPPRCGWPRRHRSARTAGAGALHLEDVARAGAGQRPLHVPPPGAALEGVHRRGARRAAGPGCPHCRRVPLDHEPERDERVAAGQLAVDRLHGEPADQADLVGVDGGVARLATGRGRRLWGAARDVGAAAAWSRLATWARGGPPGCGGARAADSGPPACRRAGRRRPPATHLWTAAGSPAVDDRSRARPHGDPPGQPRGTRCRRRGRRHRRTPNRPRRPPPRPLPPRRKAGRSWPPARPRRCCRRCRPRPRAAATAPPRRPVRRRPSGLSWGALQDLTHRTWGGP